MYLSLIGNNSELYLYQIGKLMNLYMYLFKMATCICSRLLKMYLSQVSLFSTVSSILYIWYLSKLVNDQFYLRIFGLLFSLVFGGESLESIATELSTILMVPMPHCVGPNPIGRQASGYQMVSCFRRPGFLLLACHPIWSLGDLEQLT